MRVAENGLLHKTWKNMKGFKSWKKENEWYVASERWRILRTIALVFGQRILCPCSHMEITSLRKSLHALETIYSSFSHFPGITKFSSLPCDPRKGQDSSRKDKIEFLTTLGKWGHRVRFHWISQNEGTVAFFTLSLYSWVEIISSACDDTFGQCCYHQNSFQLSHFQILK